MPRDIARGIASVKRFVRQQSIKGVHGTLIELIECSNRLHTAIEVRRPNMSLEVGVSAGGTLPWFKQSTCIQMRGTLCKLYELM